MPAYWPATRNGRSGTCREAIRAIASVSASTDSATWTVPVRAISGALQGTGPSSAQSTFTVPWSYWKRRRPSRTRAGRCSAPTSRS